MQGAFSRRVNELNDQLIDLLEAFLQATLDFPEEEIDLSSLAWEREGLRSLIPEAGSQPCEKLCVMG